MVMKRAYYRVGFTAGQSAELWERWKRGEGLKAIGRVLGKPSSCIFSHLSVSGGIRPPSRRRSRLALALAEREEISRGLVAGRSVRSMAMALGCGRMQSHRYNGAQARPWSRPAGSCHGPSPGPHLEESRHEGYRPASAPHPGPILRRAPERYPAPTAVCPVSKEIVRAINLSPNTEASNLPVPDLVA